MNKNSTLKTFMDDYPEVTQTDFDQAEFRVGLKPADKKQRITIMLDTGIITYFKSQAGKRGYQTLINEVLKKAIEHENLETKLRRIIREELNHTEHFH